MQKSQSKKTAQIYVAGLSRFADDLLVDFIRQRAEVTCAPLYSLEKNPLKATDGGAEIFIFFDCLGLDHGKIWARVLSLISGAVQQHAVVLYNTCVDITFEAEALAKGIRGVFHEGDSLESFEKGLQAILGGELWFSREVLSRSLREAQYYSSVNKLSPASLLTKREREILTLIASGAPNTDISETLHISPHTVKTHINNIYGKIKAPNRVQAVLWAAKHL